MPPNHKAALARAALWDKEMARPADRVAAVRLGDLERGFALHKVLALSQADPDAAARYASLTLPAGRGPITSEAVQATLADWPRDWRRFTFNTAVPLDCLLIGLVSLGFDVPDLGAFVDTVRKVSYFSSGGYTFDWPNVEVPSKRGAP